MSTTTEEQETEQNVSTNDESETEEETTKSGSDSEELDEGPAKEVESFSDILKDETLLSRIADLGFTKPTPVQAQTVPIALSGKDAIAQAQTGSGKTFAFSIPLLVKLRDAESAGALSKTFGLIVAPTRELASQVHQVLTTLASDLKPVLAIGGADIDSQIKGLKEDPRIVIGTPGRLLDLIRQKKLFLQRVRYFVLDEADEMLSMGFLEDVRAILSRLPDKRQGLFVSATITGRVGMLARSFLSKPVTISVDTPDQSLPSIEHMYCEVSGDLMAKPTALCDILETQRPQSAIIFCNTKSETELVEKLLRRRGYDARRINSDLNQRQRDRVMKKIRASELQFLVATDLAARGLDIEQIDMVINYSIHDEHETYVHRTGRTGRAGRSGKAISLIGPRDFSAFHYVQKAVGAPFSKMELPSDDEVCDAQLAHMYEVLRETSIDVEARDKVVAKKLIIEMLGKEESKLLDTEDLQKVIAKLYRHTVEHFLGLEAKSLDDELANDRKESESSRSRGREDGRRERGRDQDRDRDREPRKSKRIDRDDDRDDSDDKDNRRKTRDHSDDSDGEQKEHLSEDEVRVYVGQGLIHGLTEQALRSSIVEKANIPEGDIRSVKMRSHYAFVDLLESKALVVIEKLDGAEINEVTVPVEFAAKTRTAYRNNRGGGRGNSRQGGRGRGGDRRNNRRDRGGRGGGGGGGRGRSNNKRR